MKRLAQTLLLTLAGMAAVGVSSYAGAVDKLNFATPYNEKEYLTINDAAFVEDVRKGTNGAVDITIHANASLIKLPEMKRAVQTKQVAIGEVFLSAWSNEDPIFGLQTLPFLAASIDDTQLLWKIHKPFVAARLQKQGLELLYGAIWPAQSLFTKREFGSLKGLAGVKIRVQNPSTARIAELLSVTGVRVETADLSQAFLTGTVDAMFTSNVTTANSSGWDYIKYSYSTRSWYPLNIVFMNKQIFDALPAATKKVFTDAAAKAEERVWRMEAAATAEAEKTLKAKGVVIVDPPPAKMMAEFKDIGDVMTKDWLKDAGPDGRAIVDEFQAKRKK